MTASSARAASPFGNMAMAAVPDADHVQVVDERTIEMTLDTPNTLLFGNMAQFGNSILNPNVVEPHMTAEDPYAHEWLKAQHRREPSKGRSVSRAGNRATSGCWRGTKTTGASRRSSSGSSSR